MIRVRTLKRKPRFFRGGIEFGRVWLTLTEPGDPVAEDAKLDLTKDQAKAIRAEKRFLEVEEIDPETAAEILSDPSGSSGRVDDPVPKGTGETSKKGGGKVNVNTASGEELAAVKGIGEELAEAIVAYREEHEPFAALTDLVAVSGLGKVKVAKLADRLTV